MSMHIKQECQNVAICGWSSLAIEFTDDISKCTCKRCLQIHNLRHGIKDSISDDAAIFRSKKILSRRGKIY